MALSIHPGSTSSAVLLGVFGEDRRLDAVVEEFGRFGVGLAMDTFLSKL
jgi:hypothetical protein